MRKTVWTPDKDEALRVYSANGYTDDEIAEAMDIKPERVARRRARLKVIKPRRVLSERDESYLRAPETQAKTNAAVAEELGVTPPTVLRARQRLGLPTDSTRFRWTAEDTEYVQRHYATLGPSQIAMALGCSPRRVMAKARQLGIKYRRTEN